MAEVPPLVQTDDPSFVRDTRNHALLNHDRAALTRHRAARSKSVSAVQRMRTLEAEVAELKTLVRQLLDR